MGETRSRTTLDIRVNARQVNELERQLQRVFSPRALMDFDRSMRGLTRSIMDLNRTAAAGSAGDKRWKDMAADLRKAREEAAQLSRELRELAARQREMDARGGGGGPAGDGSGARGGGGGGGGWFGGGRNPGSGLNRGRGLGQVPMPGIGAIATGMAALPAVGLLAAGSLMAAAGTYQSHLGYQQASMGAMPFLGRSRATLGFAGRSAELTRAAQGQAIDKYGPEIREARLDDSRRRISQDTSRGGLLSQLKSNYRTNRQRQLEGLSGILPEGVVNTDGTGGGLDRLGVLAGKQKKEFDAAAGRAMAKTADEWADRGSYMDAGGRFGVKPQQALQEASQMSRAGVRPMSAKEYEFGLSARSMFGVDLATTGGLMGQMEYAGTDSSQSGNRVAQMIGSAVARGLEASEIATYLQRSNQFLQQQVQQGRQVDMGGIVRMEERLVGSGIAGWRAGGITQQFAGAGAQIGMQGPQSAAEFRLMEAMGYTGKGGFEEYASFRMKMQNGGNVAGAMPSFVSHINKRTAGMGESSRALIMQQYFSRVRTMLGPEEAAKLVAGMASGGMDMSGLGMDSMIEPGRIAAAGLGGSHIAEAGLERERIGIGAGISGTMQNLASSTNNLAAGFNGIAGPVMGKFTKAVERATDKLTEFDSNRFVDEAIARR